MKTGFTGTRRGMSPKQEVAVTALLIKLNPTEVHHGDCIGADEDFAAISHCHCEPRPKIVAHPGKIANGGDNELRANSPYNDEVRETKTHFARNREIVDESDAVIATPFESERQPTGGTWYTVGYAKKKKKRLYIVWPSGTIEESN